MNIVWKYNIYLEGIEIYNISLPCVVKPNAQGSTFGLSYVEKLIDLKPAVIKSQKFDNSTLIEQYITGKEIIDNIDIFKRRGLPYPFRVAFKLSNIDPYYTRFDSEFIMKLKDGITYEGTGIMEIMDLH